MYNIYRPNIIYSLGLNRGEYLYYVQLHIGYINYYYKILFFEIWT